MKVVCQDQYGGPEVLKIIELERPIAAKNGLVVRVHAVALTTPDVQFRRAKPAFVRLLTGLFRPHGLVLCGSFAGVVESAGEKVTRFKVGDEVFGCTPNLFGATAQALHVPESAPLVIRPSSLDAAAAAGLAYSFLTAMPFLRDAARLKPGATVLINGAAGSVGIAAVQVAKNLGAHVTAVCSARNAALVQALGADQVLDYAQDDFTNQPSRYDVVFDAAAKSTFERSRSSLKPQGVYLTSVPSASAMAHLLPDNDGKVAKMPATAMRSKAEKTKDLGRLVESASLGKITAVTDRRFSLEQTEEAHRYVESGQKSGDVVIEPNGGN